MKFASIRTNLMIVASIALLASASGCARKSTQTAPAAATPPPASASGDGHSSAPASGADASAEPAKAADMTPVFFGYDSHSLDAPARATLDGNARLLRERASLRVVIEGHCDERGTAEYNMALGELRAQAARAYLIAAGVPAARIELISYGKERPFDEGQNEAAWAKNRRAQFVVR